MLGLGFGVVAKLLWDLFNWRPPAGPPATAEGTRIETGSAVDVSFTARWVQGSEQSAQVKCSPPPASVNAVPFSGSEMSVAVLGVALEIGRTSSPQIWACGGSGQSQTPAVPGLYVVKANGTREIVMGGWPDTTYFGQTFSYTVLRQLRNPRIFRNGVETFAPPTSEREFAPGTRPQVPEPAPAVAPVPTVAPAPAPAPAPVTPAPEEAAPVPAPAPVPGGLPGGALAAPQLGQAVNVIRRTFRRSTPGSQPQQITAGGVRPLPAPGTPTTPTGTTFLPGGITLPDSGPRPTPEGMASELGKLEKKLELLLEPEGPRSLLDQINRVIDQVENIRFVLDNLFPPEPYTFPPGQYELAPVCDRDSEGVLLPPRVAPWAGGEGELLELRQKLDALAALVQHHKDLKQPTCGGRGGGAGGNVTVQFESD